MMMEFPKMYDYTSEILEWDKSYAEADLAKAVDFHLHFNPSVFTTEIFCKEKIKASVSIYKGPWHIKYTNTWIYQKLLDIQK